MNDNFRLHPRLAADGAVLGDWPLSRVLLMHDANFPWCVLVPRRNAIREIYELSEADQQQLLRESTALGRVLMQEFEGEKLNVAALGNVVAQLHVHHIVRYAADPAWPAPVWGRLPALAYERTALAALQERLRGLLAAIWPLA